MYFLKPYQVTDSLPSEPAVNLEEENGLELIEEVDDPVILPPVKKKYKLQIKQDSSNAGEVFYGIKNEGDIPIRYVESKATKETPLETLFNLKPIAVTVANWQIILLIGVVILLGFVKAFSRSRFNLSIKAMFNHSVAQEITREEKVFFHRSNVSYTLVHLLATALFVYHIKGIINSENILADSFWSFLLILGFLAAVYFVKYIFSRLIFFILNDDSIALEYIFNVSLFNNLLGVILIPILIIIYFSSVSSPFLIIWIAFPLVGLTFLFRLVRLYLIGNSKGISYFYIFLYICTLEILPLVVLYRIFIL